MKLESNNRKHKKLDFLTFYVPGFDIGTYPEILEYYTIRERDEWKPSIFYGIGNLDLYTIDNYWYVTSEFNKNNFESTLIKYLKPYNYSNKLPFSY